MKNIFKNEKVGFFALGALAVVVGSKIVKSKTFRNGCVNTIAGGMKLRNEAAAAMTKMKEEAEDICFEASQNSKCDDDAVEAEDAE